MNINFNLARPAADISPVRLVITHRGKVYRKSTGLSVRTARWNARRQMSGDLTADRRLNEIRAGFEERLDALSTDSDVRAAIAEVLGGGRRRRTRRGCGTGWTGGRGPRALR